MLKDHKMFFRSYLLKTMLLLFGVLAMSYSTTAVAASKFISYTEAGQGEPLVLIHAFPTDKELWSLQIEGLKKYFRVIAIDLWGFGQSTDTDGNAVTMTEYADQVKELLDQLHIQKAVIGGESMGGYIALAFLEKYPRSVSGLVLSDTQAIADSEEAKVKREATARDVLAHGTEQLISGFMPKALTPQANDQIRKSLMKIVESQSPTAVASALRGMALRSDTSNLLSNTSLPILIMTGDQDTLISPLQSQHMHQLAKNSKLVTIANAAHLSSLEQPEQWNRAVVGLFYQK
jgi:pimeloyl-ACP methyl ester carboxylesterase